MLFPREGLLSQFGQSFDDTVRPSLPTIAEPAWFAPPIDVKQDESHRGEAGLKKEATMGLENLVQWTRDRISQFTAGDVPVTSSGSLRTLTSERVAVPSLDLYENQSEFRLVVDVPGATPSNTRLAWNDFDALAIHVQRGPPESDWYREVDFSPDADGTKAHSTLRDGVLTIRVPKRRTTASKLIPVYAHQGG